MVATFDRPNPRPNGWSRQRRWLLAMSLMVAFLCSGLAGVLVIAFLNYTDRQGDALGTPVEAVDTYLLQLNAGEEIGLLRSLGKHQRSQLLRQWRSVLTDMRRTDPPPNKLVWSKFLQNRQSENEVQISVPVAGEWWQSRGISYSSAEHPWVFQVHREDGGWRLTAVQPFPWCGGYVLTSRCR